MTIQMKAVPNHAVRVAVVPQALGEVAVGEPEGDRETDPVGVDLQRTDVEDDGYWLHGSPELSGWLHGNAGQRVPRAHASGTGVEERALHPQTRRDPG